MRKGKKWAVLAACMMMGASLLAGCSSSEDGSIQSSATAETPASADMEEQTAEEEKASMSEDEWRMAYAKYLESADCPCNDTDDFYLIYVNDDDIPELYQHVYANAEGGHLIYLENGEAKECNIFRGGLELIERTGNFGFSSTITGGWCEAWYVYDGSVLEKKFIGTYANADISNPPENITWNDEEVSKEQYLENLCQVIPKEYQNEIIGDGSWLLYDVLDTSNETDWYNTREAVAAGKQAMIQWLMAGLSSASSESTGDDSWKSVYLNLISASGSYAEGQYTPVYINDDDVPEIIVTSESGGIEPGVLFVQNGEYSYFATSKVYYNEKQGWFMTGYDDIVSNICYWDGETLTAYHSGDAEAEFSLADGDYSVDGTMKIVLEADYQALLSRYYTDETMDAAAAGTTMSYSEFLAYLQE